MVDLAREETLGGDPLQLLIVHLLDLFLVRILVRPEILNLNQRVIFVVLKSEVIEIDVTMDDLVGFAILERTQDLLDDGGYGLIRPLLLDEPVVDSRAGAEFLDDKQFLLVLLHLEDFHDVGMSQTGDLVKLGQITLVPAGLHVDFLEDEDSADVAGGVVTGLP